MKKAIICLFGCILLTGTALLAQDDAKTLPDSTRSAVDTVRQAPDTLAAVKEAGSIISRDTAVGVRTQGDTTVNTSAVPDTTSQPKDTTAPKQDASVDAGKKEGGADKGTDNTSKAKDTVTGDRTDPRRTLDTRWFISPLLKFQFQDFAMLEKNRKGYLSDANTLPFFQRGNASFAASAYKNLTGRLAFSADLGLSFGHVTNDNVLISQTRSKTYNLLNAALYYHLLAASYRLQPYITVGINDIINDGSFTSIPMGIGAKFNSKKIMVLGQVTYGYALNKSISNTTMYSLGIYLPINNKKKKQLDNDDNSAKSKDDKKKKDSTAGNGGSVTNNIYITINMDSVLKSKGLLDENGNPIGRGKGEADDNGNEGSGGNRRKGKNRSGLRNFDLDDFGDNDYRMDSLDGQPVIRFVVYFEFNDYGLNSSSFSAIDRVIGHLRRSPNEFKVEIKGYTDSIGTDHFNNLLSRKRAKMVLDYMNSRGVPTELMQAKAYGKDDPVADNGDPNKAWLNRRAEIIVHQKEGVVNKQ